MKIFNIALLSAALLSALAAPTSADARGRHHHHHHSRGHVGIFFGGPIFPYYAPYYAPRYYYPPAVVVQQPPVYIEQSTAAPAAPAPVPSAQSATAYWYYCADSATYYPYVQQCASPWQQVVPQ